MKKNSEQTAITRQNLIDAFCHLLKKKPVQKITIQSIADKAGYNRGTFYKYFLDVYDILEHVENLVLAQVKENFLQNIQPENFEQTFFEAFTKIQRDKSFYFDVLFNSDNQPRFVGKLIAEVSPIFMEKFKLPPENLQSKILTEIYFRTVIAAITLWINSGRALSVEDFSKFLRGVLANGVLASMQDNFSELRI